MLLLFNILDIDIIFIDMWIQDCDTGTGTRGPGTGTRTGTSVHTRVRSMLLEYTRVACYACMGHHYRYCIIYRYLGSMLPVSKRRKTEPEDRHACIDRGNPMESWHASRSCRQERDQKIKKILPQPATHGDRTRSNSRVLEYVHVYTRVHTCTGVLV